MDIALVVGRKQLFPASNGSFRMMTTNHVRETGGGGGGAEAGWRCAAASASAVVHITRPEESPLAKLQLK